MDETYDALLFSAPLEPEQRAKLEAALDADPELAAAFRRWQQVRTMLRQRLDAAVPDRQLLALYALDEAGAGDGLSARERQRLKAARSDVEQALGAHPGLRDAVQRMADDCEAFEATWAAHRAAAHRAAAEQEHTHTGSARKDRPARAGHQQRNASVRQWAWRGVAALAVVAIAMLVVMGWPAGEAAVTVTAEADQVRQVTFADGSTARLMPGAQLTYVPADEAAAFKRAVELARGNAFFDVADAPRPFVVTTPTARATVLGTRFGVQVQAQVTNVVLASGRLRVADRAEASRAVTLEPGQASRVPAGASPTAPAEVNLSEALAWTGLFIFRDTPAGAIANRLQAHYGTAVSIAPALRDEGVTGTFERSQPLPVILETLAATLGARVDSASSGYRLTPAPAP